MSHAHLTRLDFAVGSAGLMRQSLTLALNHAGTCRGFGRALAEQPMMANVLADMPTDHIEGSAQEKAFARVATPMARFFNCSRARHGL